MLLALLAWGCAGDEAPRSGLAASLERLDQSEFPCHRTEPVQEYLRALWTSLQDSWTLPAGAASDETVKVQLEFDGRGETRAPQVVASSDDALQASVERAWADARLPEPSDEVRSCLAGQVVTATFRQQPR